MMNKSFSDFLKLEIISIIFFIKRKYIDFNSFHSSKHILFEISLIKNRIQLIP